MVEIMKCEVLVSRSTGKPQLYLLTLSCGLDSTIAGAMYPQAYATVDDFGNLVVVSAWR